MLYPQRILDVTILLYSFLLQVMQFKLKDACLFWNAIQSSISSITWTDMYDRFLLVNLSKDYQGIFYSLILVYSPFRPWLDK